MVDTRTYPSGVPCWIDTEQPDPQAASEFYGGLFGWTFHEAMPPGAPGSYLIAQLDGSDVGAIAPATDGTAARWNTYISVDDADSSVDVVTEAGGQVVSPPWDAGPGGRAAIYSDPSGAIFRVWQARRRLGAQVANVAGAWNFSDLHTTDLTAAEDFYASVFSWEADHLDYGNGESATMWRRPGYGKHLAATVDPDILERQSSAGAPKGFEDAIAFLHRVTDGEVPHWHVTFTVADRDESVATALRLGATDVSGPVDATWTKSAVLRDPQGATFSVSQFNAPSD